MDVQHVSDVQILPLSSLPKEEKKKRRLQSIREKRRLEMMTVAFRKW